MLKMVIKTAVVGAAAMVAMTCAKAETITLWLSTNGASWTQEAQSQDPTDFYQPQIKNYGAFSIITGLGSDLPQNGVSQTYSINTQISITNPGTNQTATGGTVYVLVVENGIASGGYDFSAASVNTLPITGQGWTVTQAIFIDPANGLQDVNPGDMIPIITPGTTTGPQTCPNAGGNVFTTSAGSQVCDLQNQSDRTFASAFALDELFEITAPASILNHPNYGSTNLSDQVSYGAVPEPSTWALLGLGFAGIGFAGFSRHKRARYAL